MNHHAAIMLAISRGAHRTRDISDRTGIARDVVRARIAELARERLVSSFKTVSVGKRGRPEHFYRIREAS